MVLNKGFSAFANVEMVFNTINQCTIGHRQRVICVAEALGVSSVYHSNHCQTFSKASYKATLGRINTLERKKEIDFPMRKKNNGHEKATIKHG